MSIDPPITAAPAPPAASRWPRWAPPAALAWSGLTALAALAWAGDRLPHPFGDANGAALGAVFNTSDPLTGAGFTLALGLVAIGTGVAAARAAAAGRRPGRATEALAWLVAAVIVLVLVHGRTLVLLGYTPVALIMGPFLPGLWREYVQTMLEPEAIFLLSSLAGGGTWGLAALTFRRRRRHRCLHCGRAEHWCRHDEAATRHRARRVGHVAVGVGVVSALAYPAVRLPWLFGIPVGVDAEAWASIQADPDTLAVGIALGTAAAVGAVLMTGLVRDWGVRVPRWVPALAGRSVPVALAVVPAAVVAIALIGFGRGFLMQAAAFGAGGVDLAAFFAMIPWGIGLGVGAGAYALRRRGPCDNCGQGWPETLPSAG